MSNSNIKDEDYYATIDSFGKPQRKAFFSLEVVDSIRHILKDVNFLESYINAIKGDPTIHFNSLKNQAMNSTLKELVEMPEGRNPLVILVAIALLPKGSEYASFAEESLVKFANEEMNSDKINLLNFILKLVIQDESQESIIKNRANELRALIPQKQAVN